MNDRREHDHKPPPQIATTGHEWDGIRELNTPLPRWWLWLFYADHHLGRRLLDRLSVLAAIDVL